MSEKVVVELPARLAAELASANQALITDLLQRGLRELHVEQALNLYSQGNISFAAAAEQAGVSIAELARAAYVRNIEPAFDPEMVAEELQ
jgi:predicted HTH domain antitoxin